MLKMKIDEKFYVKVEDIMPAEELPRPKKKFPIILISSGEDK